MKICIKCKKEHNKNGNFCSRSCSNSRVWTDDDKLKKSHSAKISKKVNLANKIPRNWFGGKRAVNNIKKTKVLSICLKCGKNIINKTSRIKKYHPECWKKSSGGLRVNSTIKHQCYYKENKMDSGAEKQFAILCDENNIKWIKNIDKYFEYIGVDNKIHKYYPDFYLPELDKWIEIKGKFYADKDKNLTQKLNSVKDIKIIYSTELKNKNIKDLMVYGDAGCVRPTVTRDIQIDSNSI